MFPGKTLDLQRLLQPDNVARQIADMWVRWKGQRKGWEAQKLELRNYVFATDTTTTTNSKLPWKNKTTRPKLCQIRDNLHANYMAALFSSDRWCKWQADEPEGADAEKARAIEAFMYHKFKEAKIKKTVSQLVYDFIDYGNVFGDAEFVREVTEDEQGNQTPAFVGPRLVRISPYDHLFDITARSYEQSPKITRSLLSFGQIEKLRRSHPDWKEVADQVLAKIKQNRVDLCGHPNGIEKGDYDKIQGFIADGFNTLHDYYSSGSVEFLEFEGDLFDPITGELHENHVITVVDRLYVIRDKPISNWFGRTYKQHCGWRLRPDNLMAMGPLDNLVGLQYRIDHLENLKADCFDLIAFPPLKVKGYVEDFQWGPNERIFMEQDADVESLAPDTTALSAELEIQRLEQTMEEMAGAPKQAMGVRTPGEKTAFEVNELANASSRVFQNKITYFEENFLEPLLNALLEVARRNMDSTEVVRVVDNELGVTEFLTITRDDIAAKGKVVPMGARHFAAQNQLVQNLVQLSATPMYQDPGVIAHLSGKKMAQLMEENLNLERFGIYRPNVRIEEQLETQQMTMQAEEELMVNGMTPTQTPDEVPVPPEAQA